MNRIALAALALAASTTFALAATDDELRQQILGQWGADAACAEGQVTFNADGSLAVSQPRGYEATGTWSIDAGVFRSVIGDRAQPDAALVIADGLMTLTAVDPDQPKTQDFHRCPA